MVMTVPLFVVMFALMWALYIMISIVMFLKRTNKINTHWSRKMVTLAALLSLQGLCLSFLGTVGNTWSWWLSFPFQREVKLPSEQLMTTFLPCHYFVIHPHTSAIWSLARLNILFSFIWLTLSCMAFTMIAAHASPFHFSCMSTKFFIKRVVHTFCKFFYPSYQIHL